jgi:hypothetical protein
LGDLLRFVRRKWRPDRSLGREKKWQGVGHSQVIKSWRVSFTAKAGSYIVAEWWDDLLWPALVSELHCPGRSVDGRHGVLHLMRPPIGQPAEVKKRECAVNPVRAVYRVDCINHVRHCDHTCGIRARESVLSNHQRLALGLKYSSSLR